jgi:signal transduction protein with GAF and PtsI domain
VNFAPEQWHERVAISLGHPAEVAHTKRPLLLRDTALHAGFVKILQSFRAGSSVFAPLLWQEEYLGVLICANAARNTFGEADLRAHQAFAGLAAALWVAHGGAAWLAALDLEGKPGARNGDLSRHGATRAQGAAAS